MSEGGPVGDGGGPVFDQPNLVCPSEISPLSLLASLPLCAQINHRESSR